MVKLKWLILLMSALSLFGCGGGGGSTASDHPTTAVLKFSTAAQSATALAGVSVTVQLPAGVTVGTDANGGVKEGEVVASGAAASGAGSSVTPIYTPATSSTPATLTFVVASNAVGGFATGEFATVTLNLATGVSPQPEAFVIADFKPTDLQLNTASGVTSSYTLQLK